MLSKIIYLAKAELKHNFLPLVLVNLIIMGIAYFIFGFTNLDENVLGIIIERFLPLAGIFSLVTLFYAEHNSPIKDMLVMRKTSLGFIYLVRFILRTILYGAATLFYIQLLARGSSVQAVLTVFFHSLSIGALIGAIGLLVFSLSNNLSLACLSSLGLMLAQWFIPKDKAKALLLFTMPNLSVRRIVLILGICLVLLVSSVIIWRKKPIV